MCVSRTADYRAEARNGYFLFPIVKVSAQWKFAIASKTFVLLVAFNTIRLFCLKSFPPPNNLGWTANSSSAPSVNSCPSWNQWRKSSGLQESQCLSSRSCSLFSLYLFIFIFHFLLKFHQLILHSLFTEISLKFFISFTLFAPERFHFFWVLQKYCLCPFSNNNVGALWLIEYI